MVSYWIKAASNTFENTYWLKQIDLAFMSSNDDQQWHMGCLKLHELGKCF